MRATVAPVPFSSPARIIFSQPTIDGIHPDQPPGRKTSQLVCPARFRTRAGAVEEAVRMTKSYSASRYAEAALKFAFGIVNIVFIGYTFHTRPERDPDEHLNLSRLIAVYTEFIFLCLYLLMTLLACLGGVCCPESCCSTTDVSGRIIEDLNAAGNLPHMDTRDYSKGRGAAYAIALVTIAMDFSLFQGIQKMNIGSFVRLKKRLARTHESFVRLKKKLASVHETIFGGVTCCYIYSVVVTALLMLGFYLGCTAAVVVKLAEVGGLVADFQLGDMTAWQVFSVVALLNQASVRALLPASHACSSSGLLRASILVARPG